MVTRPDDTNHAGETLWWRPGRASWCSLPTPVALGYPSRRRSDLDLRASDAEREAVVEELGDHMKAGRLDLAELDERVDRALRARTRRELAALLEDLPAPAPTASPVSWAGAVVVSIMAAALALAGSVVLVLLVALSVMGVAGPGAGGQVLWFPVWLLALAALLVRRAHRARAHLVPGDRRRTGPGLPWRGPHC